MADKDPKDCDPARDKCDPKLGIFTYNCGCVEWCAHCNDSKYKAQAIGGVIMMQENHAKKYHGWHLANGPDPRPAPQETLAPTIEYSFPPPFDR